MSAPPQRARVARGLALVVVALLGACDGWSASRGPHLVRSLGRRGATTTTPAQRGVTTTSTEEDALLSRTKKELVELCRAAQLKVSGNKPELVARLLEEAHGRGQAAATSRERPAGKKTEGEPTKPDAASGGGGGRELAAAGGRAMLAPPWEPAAAPPREEEAAAAATNGFVNFGNVDRGAAKTPGGGGGRGLVVPGGTGGTGEMAVRDLTASPLNGAPKTSAETTDAKENDALAEAAIDVLLSEIAYAEPTPSDVDPSKLVAKTAALTRRGGALLDKTCRRRLAASARGEDVVQDEARLKSAVALLRGFASGVQREESRDAVRYMLRAATESPAKIDQAFRDLAAAGKLDAPLRSYVDGLLAQRPSADVFDGGGDDASRPDLLRRVLQIIKDRVDAEAHVASQTGAELRTLAEAMRLGQDAENNNAGARRAYLERELKASLDFAQRFEAYVADALEYVRETTDLGHAAAEAAARRVDEHFPGGAGGYVTAPGERASVYNSRYDDAVTGTKNKRSAMLTREQLEAIRDIADIVADIRRDMPV